MNFAILTEKLGRVYKKRAGKKAEPRELVVQVDVQSEVYSGELAILFPVGRASHQGTRVD